MELHLRAMGMTCDVASHSVSCHPTQVNTPCLNPGFSGWYFYSVYLLQRDGRLSWPRLHSTMAYPRASIQVLSWQCTAGCQTHNLLITSVMP